MNILTILIKTWWQRLHTKDIGTHEQKHTHTHTHMDRQTDTHTTYLTLIKGLYCFSSAMVEGTVGSFLLRWLWNHTHTIPKNQYTVPEPINKIHCYIFRCLYPEKITWVGSFSCWHVKHGCKDIQSFDGKVLQRTAYDLIHISHAVIFLLLADHVECPTVKWWIAPETNLFKTDADAASCFNL